MSYESWGRLRLRDRSGVDAASISVIDGGIPGGFLPFGNGRSYGDSCHNDAGTLVDCRSLDRIIEFDPETGDLHCQAGVLLSDILAYAIPRGFFPPVTPGTQYVTVGGAIANDVHGKNHHRRGVFGNWLQSFRLMRSDLGTIQCDRRQNSELFAATIGGMGLTGLITDAVIRLVRTPGSDILQHTLRFSSIDGYFDAFESFDRNHEYAVAWIDQSARGGDFGRGLLLGGDHAQGKEQAAPPRSHARLSVPFTPPISLVNSMSMRVFNALYFRKENAGSSVREVPWRSYFYPLDALGHWNRLYGPRGLHQHQSVYPEITGRQTTIRLLECAQAHGHASFLTVLKRFGSEKSPGLLSFPRPGFTLTLDFANRGKPTETLLDALDRIVMEAGGAVNPYKDGRMPADVFAGSFPNWRDLENVRDPALMSDFWRRTAMTLEKQN
ncbi:FAD-binding oxidoreductase [Hoeflea sp. CAU 1731]